jgi:hypothetical protein
MCAVPSVFCSFLTLWLPGMLLMYVLNDSEIVPVAPIINGITFSFTFHIRYIFVVAAAAAAIIIIVIVVVVAAIIIIIIIIIIFR